MVKIIRAALLIMLLFAANSCKLYKFEEGGHRNIFISNESDSPIFCQMRWSGGITDEDTVYYCNLVTASIIQPHSGYAFTAGSPDEMWETDFKVIPYIQFLIMDGEKYIEYEEAGCETIKEKVPVLRIWKLKLDDLNKCNWVVSYPSYPSFNKK